MEPRANLPNLTLARSLYGFIFLTLILVCLVGGLSFQSRSSEVVDRALDRVVRLRTSAAEEMLLRTLHADWRDLRHAAAALAQRDFSGARPLIEGMRGSGERISWIGYATTDGIVQVASGDLLVGEDVSSRPWFRSGLQTGTAVDVHDAVLLARELAPESDEPMRFIDLAAPVVTEDGETLGVVALHIDAAWFDNTLKEIGVSLGIDLFLVDAAGNVSFSTTDLTAEDLEPDLLSAARAGTTRAGRATWPNGVEYFSSLVPALNYQDLPSFGWRAIGRLHPVTFRPNIDDVVRDMAVVCGAIVLMLGLLAFGYVLAFLRPLQRMSEEAQQIAEGHQIFPSESRSTREAARLSAALAIIQSNRVNGDRD